MSMLGSWPPTRSVATPTPVASAVEIRPARAPAVAVTDATRKVAAAGARLAGPCESNEIVISHPTAVSTKSTSTHQGTQVRAKYCATCGTAAIRSEERRVGKEG